MAACLSCGNNIASTKAGSLTQFVLGKSGCSCNKSAPHLAKIAKAKLEISYCSRCSKKIKNKSHASLTAFLQNRNYCNCKRTVIVQKTSALLKASQLTSNSKHAEQAVMQAQLQQELETAKTLANTYKLVDSLGEGGMSYVYLAEHTRLHRLVALKIMKADLAFEKNEELFREEARKLVLLNHQSLVKVLDFALHKGKWPLIAMELVSGETLADRIDRLGPMETDEALSIFKKVAEGLAYIHLKGLVHKDLKPGNIMLSKGSDSERSNEKALGKSEADVKILDFGISQFNQYGAISQARATEITGSPCYMSPEEWLSGAITPRSDLYALGCSLHEALTGHVPYEAVNIDDIKEQHINAPYQGLTTNNVNPRYSIELELLLKRLLAKDADERPHSAQEVINSLGELLKKDKKNRDRPIVAEAEKADSKRGWLKLVSTVTAAIASMAAVTFFCSQKFQQARPKLPNSAKNQNEPDRDDFGGIGLINGVADSMSKGDKALAKLPTIHIRTPTNEKKRKAIAPLKIIKIGTGFKVSVPSGITLGFLETLKGTISSTQELNTAVLVDETAGKIFWDLGYQKTINQEGMPEYIDAMRTLPIFGLRTYVSPDKRVQESICRLKNLRSLELNENERASISCVPETLNQLSNLRFLALKSERSFIIQEETNYSKLRPAERVSNDADKASFLPILLNLKFLEVGNLGNLTKLLEKIAHSNELSYLIIDDAELSENSCRQIAKIKHLRWLILRHCRVASKSIDTLLSMPNLEAIDLTNNYININQVNKIPHNSSLKFIFTSREKLGLSASAFSSLKEKLAGRGVSLKEGTETWTARGFWDDPVAAYRLR